MKTGRRGAVDIARVSRRGYPGCLRLAAGPVEVVLAPAAGGRVLSYARNGTNILYRNPDLDGRLWAPGDPVFDPDGGRFDLGPEWVIPAHPRLWLGAWEAEVSGPGAVRLTSPVEPDLGVQLVRDFYLAGDGSRLQFRQTVINRSELTRRWCYWGRTLAAGGGVFLIPVNPESRFPKGFYLYERGHTLNVRPEKLRNVEVRDGYLVISGPPELPKYGLDSRAGWLAYWRQGLLFTKRFPVYPNRVYNEAGGFTVEVYYFQDRFCELEPVGPEEILPPGGRASFREEWRLLDWPENPLEKGPAEIGAFLEGYGR